MSGIVFGVGVSLMKVFGSFGQGGVVWESGGIVFCCCLAAAKQWRHRYKCDSLLSRGEAFGQAGGLILCLQKAAYSTFTMC